MALPFPNRWPLGKNRRTPHHSLGLHTSTDAQTDTQASSELPIRPSPHVKQSTAHTLLLRKPGIPRTSRGSYGDAMALTAPPAALLLVLLALAAALALQPEARARAQTISAPPSGAPAPSSLDCAGALRNLTPCLTYVERRSALTRPDKGCCGALATVEGGDDAACLCALLAGYGYSGVRVDAVRALALPTICRVDAPPPRLCAALGMPVAEPPGGAAAPMDSGTYGTARSRLPARVR